MDEQQMIVFTPRTPPLMLPRFTWQDYQDATCFAPLAKPEIVIDERLVRECEESKAPPKWEAKQEAKPTNQSKQEPKQERQPERGQKPSKPDAPKEKESEAVKPQPVKLEQEHEEDDPDFGPPAD